MAALSPNHQRNGAASQEICQNVKSKPQNKRHPSDVRGVRVGGGTRGALQETNQKYQHSAEKGYTEAYRTLLVFSRILSLLAASSANIGAAPHGVKPMKLLDRSDT